MFERNVESRKFAFDSADCLRSGIRYVPLNSLLSYTSFGGCVDKRRLTSATCIIKLLMSL